MPCVICGEKRIIKRHFKNMLSLPSKEVCLTCFKLKMNYFPYFTIPIQYGLLHIFELLNEDTYQLEAYSDYFRPYYATYLQLNMTVDAIFIEKLTMYWIKLFDLLELGHLIIFTNYFKED